MRKTDRSYLSNDAERARFVNLNKALAVMFSVLMVLLSANVALAWLVDKDLIVGEMSLGEIERPAYAALMKTDGDSSVSLVFGRGEPRSDGEDIIEVFYGFEKGIESINAPWSGYLPDIDVVVFDDVIKPESVGHWFDGATRLRSVQHAENLDLSNTDNAQAMFKGCSNLPSLDLSSCNASFKDMSSMFEGCTSLRCLNMGGISSRDLVGSSPQTDGTTFHIFYGCESLEEIVIASDFAFTSSDRSYALQCPDPMHIPDADGYWYVDRAALPMTPEAASDFVNSRLDAEGEPVTLRAYGPGYAAVYGNTLLVIGRGTPAETFDDLTLAKTYRGIETAAEDFSPKTTSMFPSVRKVTSIAKHRIKPLNTQYWFYGNTYLADADLSSLDFQSTTNMQYMFYNCRELVSLDVSDWDMSSVESLYHAFYSCSKLTMLDVSNWKTQNLRSLGYSFANCTNLEQLDVSGWDTSSLGKERLSLSSTFAGCPKLEVIDLSKWNIEFENAYFTNMHNISNGMLSNCASLKNIDLSGFKIPEYYANTWLNYWSFAGCTALESITVPSSFCAGNSELATPSSNRHGIVNSNYWYEEGQGDPLTSAEVCQRMRDYYSGNFGEITKTTFYSYREFTDEDSYAAYYVDAANSKNILVFDRGSIVPETFDGAALSNAYREIESRCGGNSKTSVPWNSICDYVKEVKVNSLIRPQNAGCWFWNFGKLTSLEFLENLDMSGCVSMTQMFYSCSKITQLDLSMWNLSSCNTISQMFAYCYDLKDLNISRWSLSSTMDSNALNQVFGDCRSLEEIDLSSITIQNTTAQNYNPNMQRIFTRCHSLKKVSLPHLGSGLSAINGYAAFNNGYDYQDFSQTSNLEEIIVPNDFSFNSVIFPAGRSTIGNVSNNGLWYEDKQGKPLNRDELQESLSSRFRDGGQASHWYVEKNFTDEDSFAAIYGDTIVFDRGSAIPDTYDGKALTSAYRELEYENFKALWAPSGSYGNVTIKTARFETDIHPVVLDSWFYYLKALEQVENIDLLKTENAKSFKWMFYRCEVLKELDVSHFVTSSAKSFRAMFEGCYALEKIELFPLETTQDSDLSSMFSSCNALVRLDLSSWNMPKWGKTDPTEQIFQGCKNLEELIVSPTFNFSNIDKNYQDYGKGLPGQYDAKEGYMSASLWYENGSGRGYSYYDVEKSINDNYAMKSEPTIWTRYPQEEAYAAIYQANGTDDLSLVFGRGNLSGLVDEYPGHELLGVAIGYEYYPWNAMQYSDVSDTPWQKSNCSDRIKEVIVKDAVKPVSLQRWFNLQNCTRFTGLDRLDTSTCTTLFAAFANCRAVEELDLSSWDTSKVTRYGSGGTNAIFYNCLSLKRINLSGWNMSSLTTRNDMFVICPALEEIDMSGCVFENAPTIANQCYNLKKVTISPNMSFGGSFFTPVTPTDENGYDGKWFIEEMREEYTPDEAKAYVNARCGTGVDDVVFVAGYGRSPYAAVYVSPTSEDRKLVFGRGYAESAIDGWAFESACRDLEMRAYNTLNSSPLSSSVPWKNVRGQIVEVVNKVPSDDPIKPLSLNAWFYEMNRIASLDMSMFDVSNANDIASMLYGCSSLNDLRGLATWNTSRIVNMSSAFAGVPSAFQTSIANWDTSCVKNMSWIFWNCTGLTSLDLSKWSTAALAENANAFYQCTNLTSVVFPTGFVKASMTSLGQMFMECRSLTTIDTSDWNTSGLTNLNSLFYNCNALLEVKGIESWNTSSATEMKETFHNCFALSADCSGWDVLEVVDHHDFNYGASQNVIEPIWKKEASERDGATEEPFVSSKTKVEESEDGLVLRSKDKEMKLDEDAKPLSDVATKTVALRKEVSKQIVFTVDLSTGMRFELSFFR